MVVRTLEPSVVGIVFDIVVMIKAELLNCYVSDEIPDKCYLLSDLPKIEMPKAFG